ncbi:MAG: hypothetical protein HBSAPP03_07680 [Phycisphaerae bacterium]|nr:MAG: hypothetical protein HBSAPP03_07680 [Phycisphaerae bacterium]
MWQKTPQGTTPVERVTPFQIVDVHTTPAQGGFPDPEDAADALSVQALDDFTNGRITASTVAVILRGLAHDWEQSQPEWQPQPWNPTLSFWVHGEDDLPGLEPNNFPDPPTQSNPRLDARPWRHLFPKNATTASPIRAWMTAFAARLRSNVETIRQVNEDFPEVARWRFYMDIEAFILWTGDKNGVKVPEFLAAQHANPNSIWNTWRVPGSAGWQPSASYPGTHGMTLAQLYAEAASAYGWPTNPMLAFDSQQRADAIHNRSYMVWWMSLWRNVHQAVLDNAVFEPLREVFEAPDLKCGNYESALFDGDIDSTGWHTYPGATNASDQLPRCRIDAQPAMVQPPLTRHNAAGSHFDIWAGHEEHFASVQSTTGLVSSPVLYPLREVQHTGNPAVTGHQQPNYYLPGSPPETILQTSTRLHRHAAESVINSFGGNRWQDLVPWVPQLATIPNDDYPEIDYYRGDPAGLRMLLAMLRAKNVPEIICWMPGNELWQARYWDDTRRMIRDVYSGEVESVKPIFGEAINEFDPLMLEYTLRMPSGGAYACEMEPLLYTSPGSPGQSGALTGIEVTFRFRPRTDYDPGVPTLSSSHIVHINVECAVRGANPGEEIEVGRVAALNQDNGSWTILHTTEGPTSYGFYTPDGSSRRSFIVPMNSNSSQPHMQFDSSDGSYVMVLRIVHHGAWAHPAGAASWDVSEFDLVQAIPILVPSGGMGEGEGASQGQSGDMDLDGEVGENDLAVFLAAWNNGQAGADLTLDEAVDETDLDVFIQSYLQSVP